MFDFLTKQLVECVSCSGAVGLWGHQRAKGDVSKPLQEGGDPAREDRQNQTQRTNIRESSLPIYFISININKSDNKEKTLCVKTTWHHPFQLNQ